MSELVKVKMLKSERGSVNGLVVLNYEEGKTYNLPADLAHTFIKELEVAKKISSVEEEEDSVVNSAGDGSAPSDIGNAPPASETEAANTAASDNQARNARNARPRG